MREDIRTMISLQEVMLKIKSLEDEKNAIPERLSDLRREMEEAEKVYQEVSAEFEELSKQKKNLESSIEDEKIKIEKSKAKLMTVKTNKEYFAMLKEIDTLKRLARQMEDELLELMVRYEEVEKRYTEAKERYESLKSDYDSRMEEIKKEMEEFDKDIEKLMEDKEKIASALQGPLKRRFELVFRRRNGLAIVPARDYICTGCNMNIPPQLFNLLQKEDKIYECPNCSRIIYYEEEKQKEVREG
ncbi:MAG: hypothetical protein D6713_08890 [Deltaproteobacteria bacterium]|nr:MAG: hypothetical protein D6713_08890 [Deltaproteobacteria bacterium]